MMMERGLGINTKVADIKKKISRQRDFSDGKFWRESAD